MCVWLLVCGCVWCSVWCVCGLVCVCVCVNVWGVARLGARKNPRAHVQHASVCCFKTPPCVAARRPHVFNMRASCRFTRKRFETTHGGVLDMSTGGEEGRGGLSISSFLSLLLSLLRSLPPPFFSLLSFSSFLLSFSSLLSSFLFPSRQQTLYKTRINQHGVQLRGVIWRELHSTSFSARNVVTHVTILPSSPPPLLHHQHHPGRRELAPRCSATQFGA